MRVRRRVALFEFYDSVAQEDVLSVSWNCDVGDEEGSTTYSGCSRYFWMNTLMTMVEVCLML